MLNVPAIRAISLDLDDTLWPVWPTIERAEVVLHGWLAAHAPATAARFDRAALREIRVAVGLERPDLGHDLGALRLESIRRALASCGDDPRLAEPAFDVFFAARQQVTLYDDALPALQWLAARYPVVGLTNGNADLAGIGLAPLFVGCVASRELGLAKPDARAFHAAAQVAGVPPEAVLHVGDDLRLDVLGARDAGMQAAWVNRVRAVWPDGEAPGFQVTTLLELCEALG